MMMTARALLDENPNGRGDPTAISGGICRCTGYKNIVGAIRWAAEHEPRPRRRLNMATVQNLPVLAASDRASAG